MSRKSIIAILSAVVLMVVASIAMVFTVGPKTSAADETVYTVPTAYLNIDSNGYLGARCSESGCAFTADGRAWISGKKYRVDIPTSVKYIDNNAFSGCTGLVDVTIPSTVVQIRGYAFKNCSFTSITIPSSVDLIQYGAFSGCNGLTSITIPASVTSIDNLIETCRGLTSVVVDSNNTTYTSRDANGNECNCIIRKSDNTLVCGYQNTTIPTSVTSIGIKAFSCCRDLTSITIPSSVTSIGNEAFYASGLTNVVLPENVTSIGWGVFESCSSLTSVTIPDGVTGIGSRTFEGCRSLTSVTIPESVKYIDRYAFTSCFSLTSIEIPSRVTSIGDYAFYGCRGLTSITIPESVTSIGSSAFFDCSGLTEIVVRNPGLVTNSNLPLSKVHYGADQNRVTFDAMGGTSVVDQVIDFGEFAEEPNTKKEGYYVSGWYLDEEYTKPFTFDKSIKYDITLYAKWQENPTATFMVDDAEYNRETVEYNTTISVPTEPTKQHYNFIGWYLNNEKYNFETPVTENITLTAKWQPIKYTVTFESNGGSDVNSRQVDYGTTTTSPASRKTGYKLVGWKLNGETFDFANTLITEDITLVAEWEKLCVVTFNSNGGSEVATQYIENNKYASFPQGVSKQYHNLVGWKLNGETFDFVNTPITEDITLVADWAIYTYEVNFDSNGGTAVPTQYIAHGSKVTMPTDPTRDGYFFCGWYRISFVPDFGGGKRFDTKAIGKGNYSYEVVEYDFETPVTEDMVLTAVWKKIYNVVFANANGDVYTTRAVVEGDLVQAPDVTLDGYILAAWNNGVAAYDFSTPVTEDMTLTAKWEAVQTQPEQPEPETPIEENDEINNQNNAGLIWGIAGTAAGILIIACIVVGVVISKRRRK